MRPCYTNRGKYVKSTLELNDRALKGLIPAPRSYFRRARKRSVKLGVLAPLAAAN